MLCPNCQREIKDCCPKCGYMVNGIYISAEEKESESSKEREILELFIGNNNLKILDKTSNISATFLGPFYLLYRKCYIMGYTLLLLNSIFIYFFRNIDKWILIVLFVLNIIFYYSFTNSIYLYYAKRKIRKIDTKEEGLIKKVGGVSIIAPSLGILIVMIIYIFLFIFYWI